MENRLCICGSLRVARCQTTLWHCRCCLLLGLLPSSAEHPRRKVGLSPVKSSTGRLLRGEGTRASCAEAHGTAQLLHLPSHLGNAETAWEGKRGTGRKGNRLIRWTPPVHILSSSWRLWYRETHMNKGRHCYTRFADGETETSWIPTPKFTRLSGMLIFTCKEFIYWGFYQITLFDPLLQKTKRYQ